MSVRILALIAGSVLGVFVPMYLFDAPDSAEAQETTVPMPLRAVGLRLSLGIGDSESANWNGSLSGPGVQTFAWQMRTTRITSKKAGPLPIQPQSVETTISEPGEVEVNAGGR